ncbi:MAG: hypothetical protein ORN85_01965, partial [Sediminibacterium sp.]|nr:hypothetical protein [Sediminibacterium sp.]
PVITNINLPNSIEEYCQSPTFIADTFKITTTPRLNVLGSRVSFSWYDSAVIGGGIIAGQTDSTYIPSITSIGQRGFFAVVNNNGCFTTSSISTVNVLAQPSFTYNNNFTKNDSIYCSLDNSNVVGGFQLEKQANTGGSFTNINWYKTTNNNNPPNSTLILVATTTPSNNSSSYTPSITVDSTYFYYAIATASGRGCVSTITSNASGSITVYAPASSNQPTATTQFYCLNNTSNNIVTLPQPFSVTASTLPNRNSSLSYQWYYKLNARGANANYGSSVIITDSIRNNLFPSNNLASVTTTDSFYYWVQIQNGPSRLTNCRTSSNFSGGVYVVPQVSSPTITNVADSLINFNINQKDTVQYLLSYLTGSAIKWYSNISGGTSLLNTTKLVNNICQVPYYATQTIQGCEANSRRRVNIHVVNFPVKPNAPTLLPGNQRVLVQLNGSSYPQKPVGSNNCDTAVAYVIVNQQNGVRDSIFGASNIANFITNGRTITGLTNRIAYPIQIIAYTTAGGTRSDSSIAFVNANNIVNYRTTSLNLTTASSSNNGDYVQLPANVTSLGSNYTIEVWFRNTNSSLSSLDAATAYRIFDFGTGIGNGNNSSQIFLAYDNNGLFYRSNNSTLSSNNQNVLYTNITAVQSTYNINNWNRYSLVFNGTNNNLLLYINGQLISTFGSQSSPTGLNSTGNYLGRNTVDNSKMSTVGQFRGLRVWNNRARTATQIADSAVIDLVGTEPNLLWYHPLQNLMSERLHTYSINNNSVIPANIGNTGIGNLTITSQNNRGAQWFYDTNSANGGRRIFLQHRGLQANENVFVSQNNGLSWVMANPFGVSQFDKFAPVATLKNGVVKARIYAANAIDQTNVNLYTDTFVDYNITTVPDSPTITGVVGGNRSVTISFNANSFNFQPNVSNQLNGNRPISAYEFYDSNNNYL